jgi:hypothetical protein
VLVKRRNRRLAEHGWNAYVDPENSKSFFDQYQPDGKAGPATAINNAAGDRQCFRPGQWSTGGKAKLLGISKRGNPYLRKMFIHGSRAAVLRVKPEGSSVGKWMSGLETRTARNVVIVATANKLARISWAVLAKGNDYQPCNMVFLSLDVLNRATISSMVQRTSSSTTTSSTARNSKSWA